jgi:substrate import-associated zinc metallohydrolase lipoprotein
MRKTLYKLTLIVLVLAIYSCKKEENLEVDLTKYNTDNYVKGPIDAWLLTNLETPYNIQTVYRFERNLTDPNRDLSPVALDKVEPMMNAVLQSFLKPYEKIGGKTFIKTYTPKQFVLYGSPSYNTNGSITLGSADAGRTVILYELNGLNFSNPSDVKRKIRTIHHEFTHVLNQNIIIPPSFEQVSKADYTADWTGAANTAAVAKELGFISQYSRSSFGEDFAEMVAHLLVEGQVYFENYLATTNATAAAKLREKEKLVYGYYKDYYNIDFKALQNEVQSVLKSVYGATDPTDVTQSFHVLLSRNKIASVTYDPTNVAYTTYGQSAAFSTVFNNYKNAAAASGNNIRSLVFTFVSATQMTLNVNFTQGTGTTVFTGSYDFNVIGSAQSNQIIFSKKLPEGVGTTYSNGAIPTLLPHFETYLLPYLSNRVFIADFLPTTLLPTDPLYKTYGGFYVSGTPANYFYGPIVTK